MVFILQVDTAAINRIAYFGMIPFVAALAFIVFVFYRRSREEKLKNERVLLELTALRAQMNPHFIFNCLNAIYNSIQAQRNEEAGNYLLKFSYLTRRILENAESKWISIEEDMELLKTYCDLEKIRLNNPLQITFNLKINNTEQGTEVPMLLIQPLLENIIWHGLASMINGYIVVDIHVLDQTITYFIRTNARSAQQSTDRPQRPGKTKSMGRSLVKNQLDVISSLTKSPTHFKEWTTTDLGYPEQNTQIIIPHVTNK